MNKYQFRAIRNSFIRDRIYSKSKGTKCNNLIDEPIMGKSPEDVIIIGKPIKKYYHTIQRRVNKGNNMYEMHHVDFKHISATINFITKNNKIIYWNRSIMGADYWAAWRHLTAVYHGYGTGIRNSCCTLKSVDDFDCEDPNDYLIKEFNEDYMKKTHTEYQKKMFAKTGKYFTDKIIVSQKEIDDLAEKEYHWI